ncbi:MAG: nucleotidyltransferase [Clostridia bacterium]|nr:nucleotidyltransferase [Clostridia bacterium]MBR6523317.1 nucleotidyltransferase [Clostridia bacterium]
MKIAAIVCEYNPFHKGHQFHIEETLRQSGADAIIAIMSGNYVQRGDVAIYPKHLRAKAALLGGADLVLELPSVYSTGSAEFFAKGAVETLSSLGIADTLSFGAETPDSKILTQIATLLATEPLEFAQALKKHSSQGISFPSARAKAIGEILGSNAEKVISEPNNILAIEYCKALFKSGSEITPLPIQRTGANHDSIISDGSIASATLIRDLLVSGHAQDAHIYMPYFTKDIFADKPIHSIKALEKSILCELVKIPTEKLKKISDVSEGLENRIKDAAISSSNLDELIESVKTKRYTHSRVRRIILSAFLGITDSDRKASPRYIKILDHNETGQKIIAAAKKASTLPIVRNTSQVNKLNDPQIKSLWERERIFDKIYEMTEI